MSRKVIAFSDKAHRSYDIWAHGILVIMIVIYTMYFMVRLNFSLAMPFIQQALNYTKTDMGLIITASFFVFGIGKFVNGMFSEFLRPKTFLAIGLLGSSLANILFANATSLTSLTIVWSINSFFQSLAWPQCVRLMKEWFSPLQMGTRWAVVSLANQGGSIVIFAFFTFIIDAYGWQASFIAPGIIGIICACITMALPLEIPSQLGLYSVEKRHGLREDDTHILKINTTLQLSLGILKEILTNRLIWYVSFSTFFLYIVKAGFCAWGPTFLKEARGLPLREVGWQMIAFEIAGVIGSLTAGWVSDKIFSGRRGPVGAIYMLTLGALFTALAFSSGESKILDIATLIGIGFMIFGPQIMVGTASVDFSSKRSAVAANGFVGFFGYFGSSFVSGLGIGHITDNYGWRAAFGIFVASAFLAAIFFALIWKHRSAVLIKKEPAEESSKDLERKKAVNT